MAVLFALRIRRMGYRVLLWQLSERVAREYGLSVVDSLEELAGRCDAIVYGGGGLFTNAHRRMESDHAFGTDMLKLCALVSERRIPLVLASVGGDGKATVLSQAQVALLECACLVTLRNEEDREWAQAHCANVRVHADVVWCVQDELDLAVVQEKPGHVLVHYAGRLERVAIRIAVAAARWFGWRCERFDVRCERALGDAAEGAQVGYGSLKEMLQLLRSTRLVFTNRLHLGMTVIALGGAALALRPEVKARIVLKRVGLGAAIVEKRRALLRCMNAVGAVCIGSAHGLCLSKEARSLLAQDASRHFAHLKELLGGRIG